MVSGAICEAQWRVTVGIVSTAEWQQEISTETVATVSRYSDTLAASMTYLCSSCLSLSKTKSGARSQEQSDSPKKGRGK